MAKIKIEKRYGTTPSAILRDKNLSWKAKWLWAYISSLPDDFDFAIERFEWSDGLSSTRSWVQELINSWYLKREFIPIPSGGRESVYVLSEHAKTERSEIECSDHPEHAKIECSIYKTNTESQNHIIQNHRIHNTESQCTNSANSHRALFLAPDDIQPEQWTFDEAKILFQKLESAISEGGSDVELQKFFAYWTAKTKKGVPLWYTQKTFHFRMRLATWMSKAHPKTNKFQKTWVASA